MKMRHKKMARCAHRHVVFPWMEAIDNEWFRRVLVNSWHRQFRSVR